MILCIGATPAAQRVLVFERLTLDQVNRARTALEGIAGKSINVAKVLATVGAAPIAVGLVGGVRGKEIIAELERRKIETAFVEVPACTRLCTTILDRATGMVTELVEESASVPPETYSELMARVETLLPRCRGVVMSGSLTPGGPANFYQRVTKQANRLGVLSIVDAQGPPLLQALSDGPHLVKPNRAELAATVNGPVSTEAEAIQAMDKLRAMGARMVVVTAGKAPALAGVDDRVWRIEPPAIAPVNPIGSGDAFTAALVWRLEQNESLEEACRWAAASGAANALSAMPGELDLEDLRRLVREVKVQKLR